LTVGSGAEITLGAVAYGAITAAGSRTTDNFIGSSIGISRSAKGRYSYLLWYWGRIDCARVGLPLRSVKLGVLSLEFYPAQPSEAGAGKGAPRGAVEATVALPKSPVQPSETGAGKGAPRGTAEAPVASPRNPVQPLRTTSGHGGAPEYGGAGTQAKGQLNWREALRTEGFIPLTLPDGELRPGSVVYERFGDLRRGEERHGEEYDREYDTYPGGDDAFPKPKVSDQVVALPIPSAPDLNGIQVDCSNPHIRATTAADLKSAARPQSLEKLASESRSEGVTLYVVLSSLLCVYRGQPETIAVKVAGFTLTARTSPK
jgi:hypothetical protein